MNPAVREILGTLIGFDSTSHRSNLDIIEYLREILAGLGAECRLTYDDDKRKANLHAVLGPKDQPGIMLSGHTDVVPVTGQDWHSDPFALLEKDGKLYGRGTADMKSFLALAVALAPDFLAKGLREPIHFAFSYDEEVGCVGVHRLIAELKDLPVKPRLCVVGEPTGMKVVAGHKGKRSFKCRVHGKECHSSLVEGVNAIDAAAEMIVKIKTMQRRICKEGPFDFAYDPPYTTLHTGVIEGGRALNIVPALCEFEFEIRALAVDNIEALTSEIIDRARALEPDMQAIDPSCKIDINVMNDTDGFDLEDHDAAVRLVRGLTGDNRTGRVSFGTEAGLFNRAGIPTVVCGPGFIEQAHKPDEFIAIDQIAQGEAFLRRLMAGLTV